MVMKMSEIVEKELERFVNEHKETSLNFAVHIGEIIKNLTLAKELVEKRLINAIKERDEYSKTLVIDSENVTLIYSLEMARDACNKYAMRILTYEKSIETLEKIRYDKVGDC